MAERRGLLLLNLGSPDAPNPKAVGRYLRQFLTDPYVIDLPWWLRQILVRLLIVPRRAVQSAEAYRQVWTPGGSPLVVTTREFARKVASALGDSHDVRFAMRYGNPAAEDVVRGWNVRDVDVVPLFPQYAESSTRSGVEDALEALKVSGRVRVLDDFFNQPEFIATEVAKITAAAEDFRPDHVLLSFHGLPEHHLTKMYPTHCLKNAACCDGVDAANRRCYRAQAFHTYREIAKALPLARDQVSIGFQSRLGRRPWIKPYTDLEIGDLIRAGKRRLLVSCPSFVADCLETLEEIQMRLREQFIAEGGEDLHLVPAPNADEAWIKAFVGMITRDDMNWVTPQRS